jgi:predicted RNA-binding protein (virulence factor B family)
MKINDKIILGTINALQIVHFEPQGAYCKALDEHTILLPKQYLLDNMKIGDILQLFVYTDSEDRLVATTQNPYALKDQFFCTIVQDVTNFGAFVDWGLPKDLFVPKNKQKTIFKVGEKRILRVVEDTQTSRLIGVEKITPYLQKNTKHFTKNQQVKLLVYAKTPLGYKVIVDDNYEGMLYHNEIFEDISIGDTKQGFIKQIRDDLKLDICLQPIGDKNLLQFHTKTILQLLQSNDGFLPYNYKSDPQMIKNIFHMSKKSYKKALTTLQNNNQITINDSGINLNIK